MALRYFLAILIQVVVYSVGPCTAADNDLDGIRVELLALDTTKLELIWYTGGVSREQIDLIEYEIINGTDTLHVIQDNQTDYSYEITNLLPGYNYSVTLNVVYQLIPEITTVTTTQETTSATTSQAVTTTLLKAVAGQPGGATSSETFMLSNNTYPAPPVNISVKTRLTKELVLEFGYLGQADSCDVSTDTESLNATTYSCDVDSKTATLRNLPFAGYIYMINIFTRSGDLTSSVSTIDERTLIPFPDRVTLEAQSTTELTLSWYEPIDADLALLLGYDISWNDTTQSLRYVNVSENTTYPQTYPIEDLSVPGDRYTVFISAHYDESIGQSQFENVTNNTYPDRPNFADITSRTTSELDVMFDFEGKADDCIIWTDNYTNGVIASCSVSNTTARLRGLSVAGGNYTIHIVTRSGVLNSTTSYDFYERTLPPNPGQVECTPVATNASLTYEIPAPSDSPSSYELDGYYVSIESTTPNFPNSTSKKLPTSGSTTESDTQSDLMAGVTYSIVVITSIANLTSTGTSSTNCTTNLNAPPGTIATDTSEESVSVSWDTPLGYFEGFNLLCTGRSSAAANDSKMIYHQSEGPSGNPDSLSAVCNSTITAGALYEIRVETTLNNSAIQTQGSNPVLCVTVPYAPNALDAVPINTESVTLTIGRPDGSQCTSYVISYSSQTSNNSTNIPCTQDGTDLTDLSSDTSYNISVYSESDYSPAGAGIERSSGSFAAEVWTLPQSVRGINETEALPWSLNVLISSPVRHSNVWQYVIRVMDSTQNIIQRINVTCEDVEMKTTTTKGCDYPNDSPVTNHTSVNCSDEFEYNITGLEPFISYSISVQAVNPGGCSLSTGGSFTTSQAFPGCVEVTNATGTSSKTIDVSWEQPVSPNGVTTGYEVRYTNVETGKFSSINVTSPNDTSTTLDDLDAYANYTIQVAARNHLGVGPFDGCEYSSRITHTRIGPPFTPELSAISSDPYSINISWTLSEEKKTGPETYYNVTVTDPLDVTPESLYPLFGFNNRSVVATGLRPYWNYTIQIIAYTIDEAGEELTEPGLPAWDRTNQSTPGAVQTFNVTSLESLSLCNQAQVTWAEPPLEDRNGIISGYRITWSRSDGSGIINETDLPLQPTVANLTVQADEKKYSFTIQAKTFAPGNTTTIDLLSTGSCKPTPFSVEEAVSDPSVVSLAYNTKTFTIQLSKNVFLNNPNGVIKTGGLVVAQVSDDLDSEFDGGYGLYNESLPWSEALSGSVVPAYRATPDDWFGNYIDAGAPASAATTTSPAAAEAYFRLNAVSSSDSVNNNADELFAYTIGETDCSKKSQAYCNGPLPSNRHYKVSVIACTASGCFRTNFTPFFWETKKVDYGWVAGVVIGILAVIALAVVGFFLWRRWMEKRENKENTVLYDGVTGHGNAGTLEKVSHIPQPPAAVRVDDFPQHVDDMHRNSDWAFNDEYQTIQDRSPKHPWTSAEIPQNRVKNRFVNILPFDHSRVKMNVVDDDEGGTDYINANYIPNAQNIREFIASQGPLQSTVDDFWRMIWEQRIKVIVMLTNVREKGKEKCAQYWPTTTDELSEYGDIAVKMISESNMNYSVIRKLQVQCNNEIREVFQFHYIVWPDFGVPSDHETVLAFVKEVRLHAGQNVDPPIVVHCSAGVGRTGTFIMLDRLLKQFRNSDSIDVFGMLLQMRNHRTLMVQTEAQYVFIHDCLKMEIEKSLFPTQDYDNDAYEDNDEGLYANSDQFQPPQKPQRPEKPPKPVETGDVELSTFGR